MSTIEKVAPMMKDREEDLSFVKRVVQSNDFQSLMQMHNIIKYGGVSTDEPVTKNSVAVSHIVRINLTVINCACSQIFSQACVIIEELRLCL